MRSALAISSPRQSGARHASLPCERAILSYTLALPALREPLRGNCRAGENAPPDHHRERHGDALPPPGRSARPDPGSPRRSPHRSEPRPVLLSPRGASTGSRGPGWTELVCADRNVRLVQLRGDEVRDPDRDPPLGLISPSGSRPSRSDFHPSPQDADRPLLSGSIRYVAGVCFGKLRPPLRQRSRGDPAVTR